MCTLHLCKAIHFILLKGGECKDWVLLQVFVSYGQKSDTQLLLSYGFMPALLSNPHNACNLRLELQHNDPSIDIKRALLEEVGQTGSMEFPLRLDSLPQNLFNFAAFVTTDAPDRRVSSALL